MSQPLVILDVGSTLVDGPGQGPASRIAALCGLDPAGKEALSHALMVTNFAGPAAVSEFLHDRFGLDRAMAAAAVGEVWAAQEGEARPIAGAAEVVESLAANGLRLALISNIWPPFLRSVRELFGSFFDQHIPAELQLFSCLEGTAKPAPELFRQAMRQAAAGPDETVMVGDSYRNDIAPASALGLITIWVPHQTPQRADEIALVRTGRLPAPTKTLISITELDAGDIRQICLAPRRAADTANAEGGLPCGSSTTLS
jgi:HAD superfamily hydrolase (TIGR01509 family)